MFKSIRVSASRAALPLVAVTSDDAKLPAIWKKLDTELGGALADARKRPGFKAELGETALARDAKAILLGLGSAKDLDLRVVRRAAGRALRQLDRMQLPNTKVHLAEVLPDGIDPEQAGRAFGEGLALANWRVDFFDGTASKRDKPSGALSITSDDKAVKRGLERGLRVSESVNYAREVAAMPPNLLAPPQLAKRAQAMAKEVGLTCRVINYEQAQKLGMGGLVNVGKGSLNKPCLIILEHKPEKRRKNTTIALVGKSITYDTGGYSLKISGSMRGMKYDKGGGMAVLGAMRAIADLNLPLHVVGLLPAAENMISEDAYRPDDIITMYNGVTVEVTNTDAEGRLVLADALAYACDTYKPTAIVDAATLTGGVVVALGEWSAGLFCNDDDLLQRIEAQSEVTGERVWRLPLWKEHRDFMRAKHADLWNSGPKRDGHPIQGAAFLSFFVDEDVPWAHLDIAGVADVDGDQDLYCVGPTGFGVRLLTELVESYI